MVNVLYDTLPQWWGKYRVNMDFQVGVQIFCVMDDESLSEGEKSQILLELLFGEVIEETGEFIIRDCPSGDDFKDLLDWYINGWNHDNPARQKKKEKVMSYVKDQWRIYADFWQMYAIDLNTVKLHWWQFCGLLWNMPNEQSSFLRVIGIRQEVFQKGMGPKAKQQLTEMKKIYQIEQPKEKKEFTETEKSKIDAFDEMMKKRRNKDG